MSYQSDKLNKMYRKLPKLNCKGECVQSCSAIKVGDIERERITKFLGYDPFIPEDGLIDFLKSNPIEKWSCNLLKEGKCSVYHMRPLICRLFGLVKKMQCPFGCEPEFWLDDDVARQMLIKAGYYKESLV